MLTSLLYQAIEKLFFFHFSVFVDEKSLSTFWIRRWQRGWSFRFFFFNQKLCVFFYIFFILFYFLFLIDFHFDLYTSVYLVQISFLLQNPGAKELCPHPRPSQHFSLPSFIFFFSFSSSFMSLLVFFFFPIQLQKEKNRSHILVNLIYFFCGGGGGGVYNFFLVCLGVCVWGGL